MDETDLIKFAQSGDLDSFNRLVLSYRDMVYNQAYRVMGERYAAEDAAQNTFISAYRKIKSFRGGSFKSWLLRIVTNQCYDELRRKKRQPTVPLKPENPDKEEIESVHWMADPSETPEDFVARGDLSTAIQDCLNKLSNDFRTVIVLVDIQGLDYLDAAEVVGKPLGTIKSRLARARLNMRECLRKLEELLPDPFRLEVKEA